MTFSEQKKRILMVGPLPPIVGGITSFIIGALDSDLDRRYKLITFGTERPTVGIARDIGDYTLMLRIGLICLVKSIAWTLSHLLTFPLVLFKNRAEIVHVHTASYWSFWENAVYVLVSEIFSKKTLFHIHGGGFGEFYQNSNRFVKFIIRKIFNLPDRVIVLSSTWKRICANFAPENKIVVLENFVDLSQYSTFKREADPSNDMVKVLFIGGVEAKEKGIYDIFKAMPRVIEGCKNILFLFVACSSIKKPRSMDQKKEMTSHARFLGYLHGDEKLRVFKESNIFLLPSYSEGLPITMLEAMAAGLSIIATSVGAIPEVIEDGKNGILIEPGDHYALAKGILRLAEDRNLRRKMGRDNVNKIRKQYDRAVIMKKLENLYAQLLGDHSRIVSPK